MELAEYNRAYKQSSVGKKNNTISSWRTRQGIICDDWDALYELFMATTNCQTCGVVLTGGKPRTRTTKCLDHDHDITDRENVRGIICHACNMNNNCTNTSGVPNVSYLKGRDLWKYQKQVNGVEHQKHFKNKEDAIRYKYEYES